MRVCVFDCMSQVWSGHPGKLTWSGIQPYYDVPTPLNDSLSAFVSPLILHSHLIKRIRRLPLVVLSR